MNTLPCRLAAVVRLIGACLAFLLLLPADGWPQQPSPGPSYPPQPGGVDTLFAANAKLPRNAQVRALALQADGKLVVAGAFGQANGQPRFNLARLNPDGALDPSFNPGAGTDGRVDALAVQPDGGIVIAGYFLNVNGAPRNGLARLNADGSLDGGFDPGSGADGFVSGLVLQPDGKLLVAGGFQHIGGAARNFLVRLNADGSFDPSFDPGAGGIVSTARFGGGVGAFARQPDGKLLIGGIFESVGGLPRRGLARLGADGGVDPSFDPAGAGTDGFVECFAVQPDGKVLVGGYFRQAGGVARNGLARLNADGSLDPSFDPGAGPQLSFPVNGTGPGVNTVVLQPDGKALVGGYFDYFSDRLLNGMLRLNADGSTDAGWGIEAVPTFLETGVTALALQRDGKVVVGGGFLSVEGFSYPGLVRLNGDGPADSPPLLPTVTVSAYPLTLSRAAGQTATVGITRGGGDLSGPLKVNYSLSGSLAAGNDYVALTGVKKIKPGRQSAVLQIVPLAGGATGKVKLTLLPGEGYTVGAPVRAKIKITP